LPDETHESVIKFLISALPVFIAGLVEDITKKVSAKQRLLAAAVSGLVFIILTKYYLHRLDVLYLDYLMDYRYIAICITVFA